MKKNIGQNGNPILVNETSGSTWKFGFEGEFCGFACLSFALICNSDHSHQESIFFFFFFFFLLWIGLKDIYIVVRFVLKQLQR